MIENHPLEPFIPSNARILMLGSFPPKKERWSMEFFYPNWINDMWRIVGLVFFGDKDHFADTDAKRFDREGIIRFCEEKGIALYDTACQVRRLKDNASDKFLEVVTPTDIPALLDRMPECKAIVTTGQKATDVITDTLKCEEPSVGGMALATVPVSGKEVSVREVRFWRMPSSSRAYPMKIDRKAGFYRTMFESEGLL